MAAEHGHLVLVLSPERSGSTLLTAMLGAHTSVIAPPELFLLRYADFDTWRHEKYAAFVSFSWLLEHLGEPSDSRTIEERFRGLRTPEVYRWILGRVGAGRILVDKTPAYARDRGALERGESLTPHYVWLRRHPLGVANSWIERRRSRRWRTLGPLGTAASERIARASSGAARYLSRRLDDRAVDAALTRWCIANETIMNFVARVPTDRISELTYEALLRSPEATLTTLAAQLGIAFEPAMLEPWKHLPSALGAGIGDERIRAHAAIETVRADSWRERLDESRLDARTRALMEKLARRDGE